MSLGTANESGFDPDGPTNVSPDGGFIWMPTMGTFWNQVPSSAPGSSPKARNCAATYWTASSSPRVPGSRPSRRSCERKRVWASSAAAETREAAAFSAGESGGTLAAGAAESSETNRAWASMSGRERYGRIDPRRNAVGSFAA